MAARIIVEDAELQAGLRKLSSRLTALKPFFSDVGEILLNSTRDRFSSETSPGGEKWAPLSKQYASWKRKKGRSTKLLQLRGYLFGSLTYQAGQNNVEVGSNRKYAAIHQFGGTVKIPGRTSAVRLRTTAKGDLLRNGNLAVFAKARHKRVTTREFSHNGYAVKIPARPFLGVSAADKIAIQTRLQAYLIGL
ncbi:MAG: phage virion morphogenesis protein [Nevskia sp.]|jgi:phage virion morphogenesis protein|nr:phage virion morphogenesis protein [Nevskia sp.]MCK9385088.1 phage virion morphogenesis protein [Nevskia sp.]